MNNLNVINLGQVFTPPLVVEKMLSLLKNDGRILEPSVGLGSFWKPLLTLYRPAVGIELDKTLDINNVLSMDFFSYNQTEKFNSIIGNPPYVRYQDILPATKELLPKDIFDERSNLYLFFIYKCLLHLSSNGEIIFITPRDFCKLTSSLRLNRLLHSAGTITHYVECGDAKIFDGALPNCAIWRFEKNNFSRKTCYGSWAGEQNIVWEERKFIENAGQLLFLKNDYHIKFDDLFFVKVGAVSGDDEVFTHSHYGNKDFVCSFTNRTGQTRRMIYNEKKSYLEKFKTRLLKRRIKQFDEKNWWQWGRSHYISNAPRIYVNGKTRQENPFFTHPSNDYDGSVLAVFPKNPTIDISIACQLLNNVNWSDLGFSCDGRFLFSQRSLEQTLLSDEFNQWQPSALLHNVG